MRYGFIRLKNIDGSLLYMETREYERIDKISLRDICFRKNKVTSIANILNCDN